MKKSPIIIFFFFIGIYFLIIFSALYEDGAIPNPFDYARITDVEYKAVLIDEPDSEAKILVTERLTFDIHAASEDNPFWELWRDLPEDYIDGLDIEYKVNSVKEIRKNGKEIVYDESSKLYWDDDDYVNTKWGYGPEKWYHSKGPYNEDYRRYECVFFYIDGIYRKEMVFEIEYEMTNAAFRYGDCSELYLALYSEDSVNYLESFKAEILIPKKDMPSEGNYEAHTYGTVANSFPFKESKTKNPGYYTFYFNLDESDLKFTPPNEYIEFCLISFGDDKHIFTDNAPKGTYYRYPVLEELRDEQEAYDNIPAEAARNKTIVLIGCVSLSVIVIISTLRKDKKMRKKHKFYEPTDKPIFYRDIPSNLDPTFAAHLVFCKHKQNKDESDGYSAIMLSLVRKGYIELAKINPERGWNFYNVKIVVKYQPQPLINSIRSIRTLQEDDTSTLSTSPIQPIIQPIVQPVESSNNPIQPIEPVQSVEPLQTPSTEPIIESVQPLEEKLEPLTLTERYYFNLIVRHSRGSEISMKKFQSNISVDYDNTDTFVRNMENSVVNIGVSEGYFQKANYQQPKKETRGLAIRNGILGALLVTLVNWISYQTTLGLAFGGYFILGITFILSAIYLNKLSKKYILLTQLGEDEYAKWRGLYKFLNSETLMKERTLIELPLWEQYLVYATAFGISDKVISALKIRCPDIDQSPMLSNPYYRTKAFYSNSGHSFRSVTRSASYTARSGGYGGHGGYGGGGRGGGGGGGGH